MHFKIEMCEQMCEQIRQRLTGLVVKHWAFQDFPRIGVVEWKGFKENRLVHAVSQQIFFPTFSF